MHESKLETIEQIRKFLMGTAAVIFSIPADQFTLRAFVATLIRRFGDLCRSKGQRGMRFRSELGGAANAGIGLALNQNQPLGKKRFYAKMERRLGIRRQSRPRGRPRLEDDAGAAALQRRRELGLWG